MMFWHVDRLLTAFLHGELEAGEQARVAHHLANCSRCRQSEARLRSLHENLPDLPVCAAPDALWSRIERQLNADHPTGVKRVMKAHSPVRSVWARTLAFGLLVTIAAVFSGWELLRFRSPSWDVKRLEGRPSIGWFAIGERARLRVGDSLTTDKNSRAEIAVANIGTVDIAPNSRVRLRATGAVQHRLELEVGALDAKVVAPPRLFVVDTRIGRAVDLGCAYHLETNGTQSTVLRVTHGEVALEDAGRSSVVPQGFSCESRRRGGLGTPIKDDAPANFREAIRRFDFESGGETAVEQARPLARPVDAISLWHLIVPVSKVERGRLYDTMIHLSRPPNTVRRDGIVHGDTAMLEAWRRSILYDLAESGL